MVHRVTAALLVMFTVAGCGRGANDSQPEDNDVLSGQTAFRTSNDVVEPLAAWTPTIAPAGADVYKEDLIPALLAPVISPEVQYETCSDDFRLFGGSGGRDLPFGGGTGP